MGAAAPCVAVLGHVEWVTHALGPPPAAGAIVDLVEPIAEPAGGAGVAAAAAARLGARVTLFTALGNDPSARRAREEITVRGIEMHAADRAAPQTPVLSVTHGDAERTILVVGARLQPRTTDDLPWGLLAGADAAYYAGEDPEVLVRARAARHLVVSARRIADIVRAGVRADVVVGSADDPDEDPSALPAELMPDVVILTDGARGGRMVARGRPSRDYTPITPPARAIDTYGCGDSFAAGVTTGLARGLAIDDAIALGARIGALCATWRGGIGPRP